MSEERYALDLEWAQLAGETWRDWDVNGRECVNHRLYTKEPDACFGPSGPWEWLMGGYRVTTFTYSFEAGDPLSICEVRHFTRPAIDIRGEGLSLFEAITRCAILARRKAEAAVA